MTPDQETTPWAIVPQIATSEKTRSLRYLNRELSWLDFNQRVLALAQLGDTPLLERARFLAICGRNLDEFFQVRVAALVDRLAEGRESGKSSGGSPLTGASELQAVHSRAHKFVKRQTKCFEQRVKPALAGEGIDIVDWASLNENEIARLGDIFDERIYPVLTPLAVDRAHPFPHISNLSLNLAIFAQDSATGEVRFARVKVPPLLDRFIKVDDTRYVPIEQVIASKLDDLFSGMTILEHHAFRVTRDAEFPIEDEADDLLEAVESAIGHRHRSGRVVRLEISETMSEEMRALLMRELEIDEQAVYATASIIDMTGLTQLVDMARGDLKYERRKAVVPAAFAKATSSDDLFAAIKARDVLVHHPYESFAASVEMFLEAASRDENVLAIKQTLYRTAGPESGVIASLMRAARAGKQVVALVELQARFDEAANVERARELEEAGVHVVYGLVGLKTHAKVLMVVRQEGDKLTRYCHIGTGNYNPETAGIYEDLGLFTANSEIGGDVADLFNTLTGYGKPVGYHKLVCAPGSLREGIVGRINTQRDLGEDGLIRLKMNSLVDVEVIDALYDASQAGCKVELVIRGICCLRAGAKGMSENITVRSILGRYLEHSRIYCFGRGDTAEYLIGSADLMPRNLGGRVEALVGVDSLDARARLDEVFELSMDKQACAWVMRPDGTWRKGLKRGCVHNHDTLYEKAVARSV